MCMNASKKIWRYVHQTEKVIITFQVLKLRGDEVGKKGVKYDFSSVYTGWIFQDHINMLPVGLGKIPRSPGDSCRK